MRFSKMQNDKNTTISELKQQTWDFCEKRQWQQFHTPKDMALNAVIEIGELLDHFRFKTEEEIEEVLKDKKKKSEIAGEFSDAFYSLLRLSDLLDLDMTKELRIKLRETAKKYPVSKAKGTNKKYNEL